MLRFNFHESKRRESPRGEAVIASHLPSVGSRLPDLAEVQLRGRGIALSLTFILPLGQSVSDIFISLSLLTFIFPLALVFHSYKVITFPSFTPMSRHGSQSPIPRAVSPETAEDSTPRRPVSERVPPPSGISELQSPLVSKCTEFVDKFKSGILKKGEASYEILTVLVASGEDAQVIKAAIESYLGILDQHDAKMAAAANRREYEPAERRSRDSTRSPSQSIHERRSRSSSLTPTQRLGKRRRSTSPISPGLVETSCSETNYDLSFESHLNYCKRG